LSEFRKTAEKQTETITELNRTIEQLRADNAELKRLLFGRKSERLIEGKLPSIQSEVRRVVEMEELFGLETDEAEKAVLESKSKGERESERLSQSERRSRGRKNSEEERRKRRGARRNLPVVRERVLVNPEQLPEGYRLEDFRELGEGEVVRRLEHVREHLVMTEYVLQTLVSKDGAHIVKASSPPAVAEGGHYGPGIYANVVVSKCDDSLPLYRMEKIFERDGFRIARSVLCNIFHRSAELLSPIAERLVEISVADIYLHMDETPQPVIDDGACRRGWIWALVSSYAIAYKFSRTRAGEMPENLLNGTNGFLHTDAYAGYNSSTKEGRTAVRCWSHNRRNFYKALPTARAEAREMLDMIVNLYRVEYKAAELDVLGTDAHLFLRRTGSKKITDEIRGWLEKQQPLHAPKSPIGKAISYAIKNWDALTVFLDDPKLLLDNNLAENALRIFALGRKNFLFVGHDEAGENLAILQTVVSTCRLHDVNPYDYIKDVLIRIQTHPASRIDELLPMNWKPPDSASASSSPPAPS
jgi:transposase